MRGSARGPGNGRARGGHHDQAYQGQEPGSARPHEQQPGSARPQLDQQPGSARPQLDQQLPGNARPQEQQPGSARPQEQQPGSARPAENAEQQGTGPSDGQVAAGPPGGAPSGHEYQYYEPPAYHEGRYVAYKAKVKNLAGCQL